MSNSAVDHTHIELRRTDSPPGNRSAGIDASTLYAFGGAGAFALMLMAASTLSSRPASALPSYARQTGQPCAACHSGFPQLTPFGRRFKLEGYTLGGTRCGETAAETDTKAAGKDAPSKVGAKSNAEGSDKAAAASSETDQQIPLSMMVVPTFTHTRKALEPSDELTDHGYKTNDNLQVQEVSVFVAGQIYCQLGAFLQTTYGKAEGPSGRFMLDNADVRYADKTKIAGMDVTLGVTANNSPTVQDVWNTTPVWSFPFTSATDVIAPAPAASPIIEGRFGQRSVGAGAYIFANDMLYAEVSAYGTLDSRTMTTLGVYPPDDPARFDGLAPYWRVALEKNWDDYSFMVGTFGMFANVAPEGDKSGPTDRITDVGGDAQFQYLSDLHQFTGRVSYLYEDMKLDASRPGVLGLSSNSSDHLESFHISGTYVYDKIWSFSAGYFNVRGSADEDLYADSQSPAALGSPNSSGWTADIAWLPWSKGGPSDWPWLNTRIGLLYTHYDEFNGASTNYDGAGRNASDNDTTYLYAWTAF